MTQPRNHLQNAEQTPRRRKKKEWEITQLVCAVHVRLSRLKWMYFVWCRDTFLHFCSSSGQCNNSVIPIAEAREFGFPANFSSNLPAYIIPLPPLFLIRRCASLDSLHASSLLSSASHCPTVEDLAYSSVFAIPDPTIFSRIRRLRHCRNCQSKHYQQEP